nr:hypothetical protein [Tanacetum cinerariifolium]
MADVNINAPAGQAPAMTPPLWDTVQYDKTVGCYRCQLDEQWFVLTKDTLREALQIAPVNNQPFISPPLSDALINFVNELGYPKLVSNLSNVVTNDMFQPWRALTTIINLCLTGKTSRIWEEFTQSIHTFIEDKRNLTRHTSGKKKATLIVIPSIRFTKLIIHHLQRRHKFHPRPDSPLHLPNEEHVLGYLKFSAKGTKREVFRMPIPGSLIIADIQEVAAEDADMQKALEGSLKSVFDVPRGSLLPVVIREPESGKYQPLPEVSRKGKAKVTEEQVAHDLLSLQKPKKKSPSESEKESEKVVPGADEGGQGEGQVGSEPGAQAEGQTRPDAGTQDEGQAGSNPDEQSEGQARPDSGNAGVDEQSMPSPVVHAGSDREHMDLDVADVSPQPSTEQMDEGFTAMAYPKFQENLKLTVEELVLLKEPASSSGIISSLQHLSKYISFGDLFFSDKPSDANNDKANAKTEVESMMSVPVQQDMSLIPPMTSPIIDLTSRPKSPKVHQQFKATTTETTTTTTTTLPPPPSQQQSTAEAMMMKRIGELEHVMTNLIQKNKGFEERLDKHGARLYTLKQLNIPYQLYEALEKSMNRDHSQKLAQDLAEARKKKKKSCESPKTPHGSPPHQPPPPHPPAGPSRASGAPGASGSSQVPPPPPPPSSTNQENLEMDEDMALDEQAQSSDDKDIGSAHIPKTGDIATCMDWFCKRRGITELKPQDLEDPAFEIVKVFHPDVIHLQYQMEECHKLLTNSVDDPILRHNVKYLRYGSKGSRPALSISKMKAAYYPDAGLEQMVPDQFWIEEECKYDIAAMSVRTHMRILSVVRIKVFSMYGYDYMKKIVLRRTDLNEHVIAERDFKYLYPSDLEDMYLLNLQGHLNHLPLKDKKILTTAMMMRFNEIHKFSDGTLQQIDEALDYKVKEFMINKINPGLNTRFWTRNDVDRSKAFMFAIQKRLKIRRIFRNLESFVGGRVRDGDYRLLKRTE